MNFFKQYKFPESRQTYSLIYYLASTGGHSAIPSSQASPTAPSSAPEENWKLHAALIPWSTAHREGLAVTPSQTLLSCNSRPMALF